MGHHSTVEMFGSMESDAGQSRSLVPNSKRTTQSQHRGGRNFPSSSPISTSLRGKSPCSSLENHHSQFSTDFLTPRNLGSCSAVSGTASAPQIEEWIKAANRFGFSSLWSRRNHSNGSDMRQKVRNLSLSAAEEEEERLNGMDRALSSELESPINGRYRFMARPKPYSEFLQAIQKEKFLNTITAWKKEKHAELMNRLRRREDAITEWEMKERRIAVKKMEKLESKLEKKRAKAMEELQREIARIQAKAKKRKSRERQAVVKKISIINKVSEKVRSGQSTFWLKLLKLGEKLHLFPCTCT